MRIGHGFDAHQFSPERRLMLGGVHIPYDRGLAGHSDADVVLHAIIDALLGAAGLGDIGAVFPSSDPQWREVDSRELLGRVNDIVLGEGFTIANIDATVVAEAPRLYPHAPAMRQAIASTLGVDAARISVKAKTSDGMGFTGRGEGIAAFAVVLLE